MISIIMICVSHINHKNARHLFSIFSSSNTRNSLFQNKKWVQSRFYFYFNPTILASKITYHMNIEHVVTQIFIILEGIGILFQLVTLMMMMRMLMMMTMMAVMMMIVMMIMMMMRRRRIPERELDFSCASRNSTVRKTPLNVQCGIITIIIIIIMIMWDNNDVDNQHKDFK